MREPCLCGATDCAQCFPRASAVLRYCTHCEGMHTWSLRAERPTCDVCYKDDAPESPRLPDLPSTYTIPQGKKPCSVVHSNLKEPYNVQ